MKRKRLPVSVSAAVFIEDDQNRLLLLQQSTPEKNYRWGPPAGGMKAHEDPFLTISREVLEEIGAKVKLLDLVGIYTVDRDDEKTGLGFVFRGKLEGKIKINKKEIKNYRFFSYQEIQQLIKEEKLYKPEYNIDGIRDYFKQKSYLLEVIKPLIVCTE